MKTQNIDLMTAEIDAHRAADLLVQGSYFDADTGHGCLIGCLAHSRSTAAIAERFGVPAVLTRLLESIFERLPFDEAADFFSEIPRAIGEDGKDLTRVHWAFLADMLRHLPDTGARGVVADVTAGMDLLAAGQDWPEEAVRAVAAQAVEVAEEAEEAVRSVVWAARAAAWSAYWAAKAEAKAEAAAEVAEEVVRAAYWAAAGAKETRRQRDAILRLIREVPAPAPDDRR